MIGRTDRVRNFADLAKEAKMAHWVLIVQGSVRKAVLHQRGICAGRSSGWRGGAIEAQMLAGGCGVQGA